MTRYFIYLMVESRGSNSRIAGSLINAIFWFQLHVSFYYILFFN